MASEWKVKEISDLEQVKNVSEKFGINRYISAILLQRVKSEEVDKFLNPRIEDLYNPFLMNGMEECVEIILESIEKGERIFIYGDYDVDGITGVSILYNFLVDNFDNISEMNLMYNVASRFDEGYGLSVEAVEEAIKNNVEMIITVDCGTKDYETISMAKKNGIKVVVLDHHEFDKDKNSEANVILNPKKNCCNYPFKELSGCGVVFKLIQAIARKEEKVLKYIDLVALSVSCDLVPVINENRIFLKKGLEKINKNPHIGISELLESWGDGKKMKISNQDLLFKIGPKMNAPGRMSNAKIVIDLLTCKNDEKRAEIAQEINKQHIARKKVCSDMVKDALKEISRDETNEKATVLFKEGWHVGVLGIVAIKCIEKKNVPTIIMTNKNDYEVVGSARSIKGVNIHEVLRKCNYLLKRFGGHEMAAGFILKRENVDEFKKKFEEEIENLNYKAEECVDIDIKMPLKYINETFFSQLMEIGPFGVGNNCPVFMSSAKCCDIYLYFDDIVIDCIDNDGNKFSSIARKKINYPKVGENILISYKITTKKSKGIVLEIIDTKERICC